MAAEAHDITDFARKQRHLHLLEKVAQKKPLTKAELRELSKLERQNNLEKKTVKKTPRRRQVSRKTQRKKKIKGKSRLPISEADVCRLGLECESLTVAESLAKLPGRFSQKKPGPRLESVLEQYPRLAKAWDRGRFLRQLRGLARTGANMSEAADRLGLANGRALRKTLEGDAEGRDLWEQAKHDLFLEIKIALIEEAKGGNQAAIKAVENFLLEEKEKPHFDPGHVTLKQLSELVGKSRQAVNDWRTRAGMPRNADKTFDLSIFLAWYEDYLSKKIPAGKAPVADRDPLRAARAEKLRIELEHHRDQLLDRERVVMGQIAWFQNIVAFCERGAEGFGRLCCNQPRAKIVEIARSFFRDLHNQAVKVPKELNLSAAKEKELTEFLLSLRPAEKRRAKK